MIKIQDDQGKFCRVTVGRVTRAIRLMSAPEGGPRFRILWNRSNHCERVIYRHLKDHDQGWQP